MQQLSIPPGVAYCALEQDVAPEHYSFVLLPSLSMHALSSAIEPLRIANQLTCRELFRWRCVSEDGRPVHCSNGLEISVDGSIDDLQRRDIVLVCSGVLPKTVTTPKVANAIRKMWRRGQKVGGLCTGAYTLAQAGILRGTPVTLHWENLPAFRELFPDLDACDQLYHFGNRIWTCAGGTAATDMMIHRIRHLHGPTLSNVVASMCLHQIPRAETELQKTGAAAALAARHPQLLDIIAFMDEHLDSPCALERVAEKFKISRRQMERLFKRYLSTTPKKFLLQLRLHRGRAIMAETNLPVADVAAACGFNSSSHFSRRFRQLFGVAPHQFLCSGGQATPHITTNH